MQNSAVTPFFSLVPSCKAIRVFPLDSLGEFALDS